MPDVRVSQLPEARPLEADDVLWAEQARDDGVNTRKVTVRAITQRAVTETISSIGAGIGISEIAAALGLPIADFSNPNNAFLLAI